MIVDPGRPLDPGFASAYSLGSAQHDSSTDPPTEAGRRGRPAPGQSGGLGLTSAPASADTPDSAAGGEWDASPAHSAIDDSVQAYLDSICKVPLLTREQEVRLAMRMDHTRKRLRRYLLRANFVMRDVVALLRRAERGDQRLDRVVQFAVSDRLEQHQIRGRLPHNLRTIEAILEANEQAYQGIADCTSRRQRRARWRNLHQRHGRAIRLVEQLGVRQEFLAGYIEQLRSLYQCVATLRTSNVGEDRQRRASILRSVQLGEKSLGRLVEKIDEADAGYELA